ncbi:MAG TPA: PEP-CTERM sorting domain-containing protein [Alphaproteobacteria bacterium]
MFEFKDEWSFRLGDILNIVHPGGDLDITPIYRLSDNLFSNLTQLFLSPGFSLDFLQLKFGGVLFSALGLGDFKVFGQFFPVTGAPAPVHTFANTSFALEDWTTDPGTTMRISAPAAADVVAAPEPATLALFVVGLAGLFAIRRRRSV